MEKKNPRVPDDLERDAKNRIYRWHVNRWPLHFQDRPSRVTFVRDEIETCLDWHRARGNPNRIVDFEAASRSWIRKSMKERGYEPRTPPSSAPSRRGKKPFEKGGKLERIGVQLRLVK